jgi:Spy/CpxP family protein refolding chaperone
MRITSLYVGILSLAGGVAQAQGPPIESPIITPLPTPNFSQLKTYLNLSDGQLQSLADIYKSRMAAQQAIYQQISAKQTQLNQLLAGGTSDAAAVGQLMIDIHNLQKQLPFPNSTYRDQALKVLTPDQTAKLPALTSAMALQQAAWQAVTLDLVDGPAPIVMPLPAAVAPAVIGSEP